MKLRIKESYFEYEKINYNGQYDDIIRKIKNFKSSPVNGLGSVKIDSIDRITLRRQKRTYDEYSKTWSYNYLLKVDCTFSEWLADLLSSTDKEDLALGYKGYAVLTTELENMLSDRNHDCNILSNGYDGITCEIYI